MVNVKELWRKEGKLIIKKQKLQSKFENSDVNNSYPISPFKGRRCHTYVHTYIHTYIHTFFICYAG